MPTVHYVGFHLVSLILVESSPSSLPLLQHGFSLKEQQQPVQQTTPVPADQQVWRKDVFYSLRKALALPCGPCGPCWCQNWCLLLTTGRAARKCWICNFQPETLCPERKRGDQNSEEKPRVCKSGHGKIEMSATTVSSVSLYFHWKYRLTVVADLSTFPFKQTRVTGTFRICASPLHTKQFLIYD